MGGEFNFSKGQIPTFPPGGGRWGITLIGALHTETGLMKYP